MDKGIIVSIQGYSKHTTEELTQNVVSGGAIAIRTDKEINCNVPIIGLHKIKVKNIQEPYITPEIEYIEKVSKWANYIAIDYRRCNKKLQQISNYVIEHGLKVIADIETIKDYRNILDKQYYYDYIATTFSVFKTRFYPDISLIAKILKIKNDENIIAEGNIKERYEVRHLFDMGINNICIGAGISDVYKLTRKYVSVL